MRNGVAASGVDRKQGSEEGSHLGNVVEGEAERRLQLVEL